MFQTSNFQHLDPFPCGLVRARTRPPSVADRPRGRCRDQRRREPLPPSLLSPFPFFFFIFHFPFSFPLSFSSPSLLPPSPLPLSPARRSCTRAPPRPTPRAARAHTRMRAPPLPPSALAAQAAAARTRTAWPRRSPAVPVPLTITPAPPACASLCAPTRNVARRAAAEPPTCARRAARRAVRAPPDDPPLPDTPSHANAQRARPVPRPRRSRHSATRETGRAPLMAARGPH